MPTTLDTRKDVLPPHVTTEQLSTLARRLEDARDRPLLCSLTAEDAGEIIELLKEYQTSLGVCRLSLLHAEQALGPWIERTHELERERLRWNLARPAP